MTFDFRCSLGIVVKIFYSLLVTGKKSAAAQNLNTDTPHTADRQTDTGDKVDNSKPEIPIPPDDGKVKVRLVKLAERAKDASSAEKTGTDSTPSQKYLDIPADKKAQQESTVKDTLEKSGLETQGKMLFSDVSMLS